MDKPNIYEVVRVTDGPHHHLFGFHDLVAINANGDKLLALEVEAINHPPVPGEQAGVGYVILGTRRFVELGKTCAFNYPQGARQQWIDDYTFIVNNRVGNHWGADIYDTVLGKCIGHLDNTCHCLSPDKRTAYGLNYARLHRLGGYGYIGLVDYTEEDAMPETDGIFATDIVSGQSKLIVSIYDVAVCNAQSSTCDGRHHYITHLVVSPDGRRIAFLHRYWLADGGIRTRLMTVGVDGSELRCLGFGFLSHFDWRDNEHLFIWGRTGSVIDSMRNNPMLSIPLVKPFLSVVKGVAHKLFRYKMSEKMNFLMFVDAEHSVVMPFAQGIITSDGHPMCSPTDRDLCICDTYPNEQRERTLFTYRFSTNERYDLGRFRMSDELPNMLLASQYTQGVDKKVLSMFSIDLFSFTRSGLHCDLHPRWNADGSVAVFDSIHEGTRQIYLCRIK